MTHGLALGGLLAWTAWLAAGCIEPEGVKHEDNGGKSMAAPDEKLSRYSDQVSSAALQHLAQVALENPKGNFMISPFSLHECLGMVRLGAEGETNSELSKWLGVDLDPKTTSALAGGYRRSVSGVAGSDVFSTANGLWVRQGEAFLPSFLAGVEKDYEGKARSFETASQALQEVNSFVKEGTKGMIPKLLERLDASTTAVLVNATSFRDRWAVTFDKQKTSPKAFQTPDGPKAVPMMAGKEGFFAKEQDGFTLGSGSFQSGLRITFALPPKGNGSPESCFPTLLKAAKEGISEPALFFQIPRLKSEFKWDLKKTMMTMGVQKAFAPGVEFGKMIGRSDLFISEALQKTFVEFDEEGVKAAAATAVVMTRSAPAREGVAFIADRPFAYVIHDSTGMPLFVGVVRDPSAAAG